MRPAKVILVVTASERMRGLWRLILHVRGYRVVTVRSLEEAECELAQPIDLVMAIEPLFARETCARIGAVSPDVPTLVIGAAPGNECATMVLPSGTAHAEIVERARVLTARKRGPRAHSKNALAAAI